jgi:hypothetical protein
MNIKQDKSILASCQVWEIWGHGIQPEGQVSRAKRQSGGRNCLHVVQRRPPFFPALCACPRPTATRGCRLQTGRVFSQPKRGSVCRMYPRVLGLVGTGGVNSRCGISRGGRVGTYACVFVRAQSPQHVHVLTSGFDTASTSQMLSDVCFFLLLTTR